ncbi:MAG: acetate/propionate family kinase [Anaerofustis sp.]
MKILVVNCGSSSLKYQLFDMKTEEVLAKGLVERIGIEGSILTHKPTGKDKKIIEQPMQSHKDAIKMVLQVLVDPVCGVLASMKEIDAVGHRVLHGGSKYAESVVIDEKVLAAIEECIPLGPLHNPANLIGINACAEALPGVPMVAVFDTAFHQTMPKKAFIYAIPYKYYENNHIRKYGFHGTSHKYVSQRAAKLLGTDQLKLITCHLGNGSSVAAVLNGKCMDTSMGLTPLDGLIMGTRSGTIDPAVIKVLADEEHMTINEIDTMLNKQSGVLGISGISSDFRDLEKARDEGNERASLALEAFDYKVICTVGAYAAALNGVDAIVFTAGVGENSGVEREAILSGLTYLGIEIDKEANATRGEEIMISTPNSRVKVMVIPTNEELMIAMDTMDLTKELMK